MTDEEIDAGTTFEIRPDGPGWHVVTMRVPNPANDNAPKEGGKVYGRDAQHLTAQYLLASARSILQAVEADLPREVVTELRIPSATLSLTLVARVLAKLREPRPEKSS